MLRITRDCGIGDMEVANRVLLQRGHSQDLLALPPPLPRLPPPRKSKKKSEGLLPIKEYERIEVFPINAISEENVEYDSEFDDSDTEDTGKMVGKHKFWWEEELAGWEKRHESDYRSHSTIDRQLESKAWLRESKQVPPPQEGGDSSNVTPPQNISVPNLLSASAKELESIVSLSSVTTPEDRIALIGGSRGVLESMKKDGVQPDIKTFGLMSELISHETEAEMELMVAMDTAGVKGDIDFYNGLINQRAVRGDMKGAKVSKVFFFFFFNWERGLGNCFCQKQTQNAHPPPPQLYSNPQFFLQI